MSEHEAVSLAGQFATLQSEDGVSEPVVFGPDVMYKWEETGTRTNSNEPKVLFPVIRGNLKTNKDFSKFTHGKLIVADGTKCGG